jgi:antirestriction protein ArdC
MKIEQAKQIASNAIEELSHALEAGHSEKLREYLSAMSRFHRYSLHNIMLIASQRPDATRVAGFHTWKRLGRFVKKGAKGILILAPVVLREEAEQKQQDEKNERAAIRFRAAYVFDMADTDGKPMPQLGNTEGDPATRTERLKEFLLSRGIRLEYSDAIYPAQGQCSPGKIVILPGQAAPEEFATLVHEMAHALLHQGEQRTNTTKRVRETEAEAVAFVVCEGIGLAASSCVDYIHLYDGNKETLAASLERIQHTSAEILSVVTTGD